VDAAALPNRSIASSVETNRRIPLPALIHPVFWMVGNAIAHGDPLYSFQLGV